jgi:hypothetical protein
MKRASVPLILIALAVAAFLGYRLSTHDDAAAGKRPPCLRGRAPARADFPAGLPVPSHLVVRRRYVLRGTPVTESYVPGTLRSVRDWYFRALSRSGFELVGGDAEEFEAETDFVRGSVRGHLKLNHSAACPGALSVAVVDRTPR